MRTILSTVAIAAILFTSRPASAQSAHPEAANATKFKIAVVDVTYVFKQHARFNATMDGMKGQMQTIEQELKGEMEKIKKKEEERDSFNLGTPDWKRIDNELTQMKASFTVQRTQRQKDFIEKEATAYYQTYLEVNDAVKYFAQRNDIGLVLRFNGEQADPNQREQILRWINKPVVYHNEIDITRDIVALLNRDAQQPSTQPATRGAAIPGRSPSQR